MPLFLKLIPVRDWLYLAVIAGLLITGAMWLHKHDNKVAAAAQAVVVQQDTKVAQAAEKQVVAGTATAETTETQNAQTYDKTTAGPAVPGVGLVCKRAAPAARGPLPQAGSVTAPGAGDAGPDGGVGPAYDPSGPLLERAKRADAQIVYLQGRIHELEQQMRDSP